MVSRYPEVIKARSYYHTHQICENNELTNMYKCLITFDCFYFQDVLSNGGGDGKNDTGQWPINCLEFMQELYKVYFYLKFKLRYLENIRYGALVTVNISKSTELWVNVSALAEALFRLNKAILRFRDIYSSTSLVKEIIQ